MMMHEDINELWRGTWNRVPQKLLKIDG